MLLYGWTQPLVPRIEIRGALIILRNLVSSPVGNVSGPTTDDPCDQQGEPKKNHCACDDSKNKDLFRMMKSKSATENL